MAVCRELQKSQKTSRRKEARVEPGLGRQVGQRGVAQAGRQQVGRERDAGDEVAAQPRSVVGAQPAQRRQRARSDWPGESEPSAWREALLIGFQRATRTCPER